jgi:DNA-binding response OmpR family regulator
MKRNADRLLRLTNQMLDFRLLELGRLNIHPENTEIISLCRNTLNCFDYQIIEKEINFIFTSALKTCYISIDPDMIEKVVYNLLSNAFKYTAENGQVILSIEPKMLDEESYSNFYCSGNQFYGNSIEIKIKDFGKGMEPEIIPKIFDRFFVNHTNEEIGTGIGLHICREYINFHHGNILVSSESGKGSIFIINIPITTNLPFEKENIVIQPRFDKTKIPMLAGQSEFNSAYMSKVILLVEDHDELRIYMKNFLSNGFKVLTAKNGNQAYEIALEVIPDLIISDILMPGIDGLELTSRIKNNPKTNHIPIILLTALSESNYKIDSMHKGADSFLTKPIDESLLLAQIDNIFNNRGKIFGKYGMTSASWNQIPDSKSSLPFIQIAENHVQKNLQNRQFDINQLADELSISRSSLHRKIKTHTNQSATEFIRDIRLKNAIRLMNEGIYNMDEIALFVGFNSTSYFNRSFRKKYGKAPKEFHHDLKKKLNEIENSES